MKKVVLINPNLVVMKNDILTTGIVYMPIGLAYFAAALESEGFSVQVIDAFGEEPNQFNSQGNYLIRGLSPTEVVERIPQDAVVVVYASHVAVHVATMNIIEEIRRNGRNCKIAVCENTQSVTAYSLRHILATFFSSGVDCVITGEPERRGIDAVGKMLEGELPEDIDGVAFQTEGRTVYSPPMNSISELDNLPIPAWHLFPIKKYWALGYAHGPLTGKKYFPIQSSRGCPYPCKFCVIPEMSNKKWRARSAKNVVDEIQLLKEKYGVSEFHLEDVDPTVSEVRTREICNELISRDLGIIWKICAGTKVETIKTKETIELMAKSGCRYVSISPESGSARLMKTINKPFNLKMAVEWISQMSKVGIYSQACFVLGFPGETEDDRLLTEGMVKHLVKVGIDEIALFIITPIPGSEIHADFKGKYNNLSDLNFSPSWREDYEELNRFRMALYRKFLVWKLMYNFRKLMAQPIFFLTRRFRTKMEMTPYRAIHTAVMARLSLQKIKVLRKSESLHKSK